MRITNSMMINTVLRDLNNNLSKMSKSQEQLSSGRRLNRPSDDPVGIVSALRLRTSLTEMAQFKSNAEDANSWLETTDKALDESGTILQRIRELAVRAANDYLTQTEKDAMLKEVDQLRMQMVSVGNATYAGKYIFSCMETQTASFNDAGTYQPVNHGLINYEIAVGVKIPINVDGEAAFKPAFDAINQFMTDLTAGTASDISADIGLLDTAIYNQLEIRADVGAKANRLDLAINRIDSENVNLTGLLSKVEDVDVAALITRLKMQESVYNSSLSVGAKIVQPTLMDFLR